MNPAVLTAIILLCTGCVSPDARIARENADVKARLDSMAEYARELEQERTWLYGQLEGLRRELDHAKGRKTI